MSRGVRYRVLRKIAHGGMAEIFLALQGGAEGFEKPVVLKRILPALSSDSSFVRMLVDEAHVASGLNHTHLVQVLDLGKAGDEFFLVLEFVDGWSLEQVRRRARKARLKMPMPLTLYIVSALCRGLDYVHRHTRNGKPLGIVHRDVTPQNVLLSREGDVKLADFGIAKAAGRREKSATGVIKGKFAYMSPEQTIGAELDARSDLFSVGTMLYVLTTGQKPFDAPTDLDVLMQVRKARHEKPSTLVRDFNPDVERFIERALRADRARRWQSAEQMADRLDNILIKLAQPSGPAALKRWLETLSARDGVLAPGDQRAVAPEPPTSTIQLVSGELELQDVAPEPSEDEDELAPRRETRRGRKRPSSASEEASPAALASDPAPVLSEVEPANGDGSLLVHPEEGTVFHELAFRARREAQALGVPAQGGAPSVGASRVGLSSGAPVPPSASPAQPPASRSGAPAQSRTSTLSPPTQSRTSTLSPPGQSRASTQAGANANGAADRPAFSADAHDVAHEAAVAAHMSDSGLAPERPNGAYGAAEEDATGARRPDEDEATFTIELDEDELAGAPFDEDDEAVERVLDLGSAVPGQLDNDDDDDDLEDRELDVEARASARLRNDEDDPSSSAARQPSGETASALLLTEPRRGRSRLFRRMRQMVLAALLVPALLGGGAYFARPFVPGWVVPATVVAWFDGWIDGWHGWLERLPIPRSMRDDRSARDPVAPHREASNR